MKKTTLILQNSHRMLPLARVNEFITNGKTLPANRKQSTRSVESASANDGLQQEKLSLLKRIIPVLALLFIYLIVIIYCLDDKIYLGGDNLTYYHLGKALASGKGYVDVTGPAMLPHNVYPPGYPFLLSIIMRMGFTSLEAACGFNSLMGFACILLSYLWGLQVTGSRALAFTVGFFLALNGPFIGSSLVTMSEVPSLFFILLAIYIMSIRSQHKDPVFFKDHRFWLLLTCTVAAYNTRTSAMMLLPAVIIFYAFRRQWMHVFATCTGFVLAVLPWMLRTARLGGNSYVRQFKMKNPYQAELGQADMHDFIQRIIFNIGRYISSELPSALFQDFFPDLGPQQPTKAYWIAGVAIALLIIYGIICTAKKQPFVAVYLLLSAALIQCWPAVWFGSRFLVPLMPFLIFMIVYAVNSIIKWSLSHFRIRWNPLLLCLGGLFLLTPVKEMHAVAEEDYPPNYQSYIAAGAWAKKNLPPNSVIACRKPELFFYFSNGVRSTMYPFEADGAKMLESFRKNKVTHVVIDPLGFSSTGKYLLPAVQNNAEKFRLLYQGGNPPAYIAAFDPKK